ncbi:MAG TPA: hypothetical protein VLK30_04945 [Candidatus Limnocylindrales bacterium]|nr:hypothetical protein [Candidatus Limnocylindrales bacterium]
MLKIDPTLPTLMIDPALPMLRMDPALPMLKIEPALPMLNKLAKLRKLYALKTQPTLAWLRQLGTPATKR